MGRRSRATLIACLALVASTSLVSAASAAATSASGYDRTVVNRVGISLLLPDTWNIDETTRKQAETILEENPKLADSGTTVELLMGTPLTASWDGDGDTYPDRLLNVDIVNEDISLPPPSFIRTELLGVAGIEGVVAKRTTVAQKPAVVATYTQHINRDDGTPRTGSASSYFFVGPRGLTMLQFIGVGPDPEFGTMQKTIVRSVRLRK